MDFTGVIPISTGQNLVLWTNTKYNPKCRYKRADTGEGNARIEQTGSVHFKKEGRTHKPRNARGEYMLIKARQILSSTSQQGFILATIFTYVSKTDFRLTKLQNSNQRNVCCVNPQDLWYFHSNDEEIILSPSLITSLSSGHHLSTSSDTINNRTLNQMPLRVVIHKISSV